MKVTRIDVEGARSRAVMFRSETGELVINIDPERHTPGPSWVEHTPLGSDRAWQLASRLQRTLDGFTGAGGDVRDYARLIELLTD